ncbi:MAG TPA: helix-turn-helix domain-containing protein [Protaetiibacter sp.]|nr:helix-turn-helix domain-containing protein [Protaetiibacter sp.]
MPSAPLLTAREAAKLLSTSEAALAQLRYRNEGPAYIKLGRAVRYRPVDIEAFIERSRVVTRFAS